MKSKNKISSTKIKNLLKIIENANLETQLYQEKCNHKYEVIDSTFGWDGHSVVECELEEYVHCKICGNTEYRTTGIKKVFG